MPNDFKRRSGELKPRELMERAASPRELSPETLLAVLLKTGAPGCDVQELSRRLLAAFGGLNGLVSNDWRGLEARIAAYNATHPERPILGLGHVKCLELSAAFELGARALRLSPEDLRRKVVRSASDAYEIFRATLAPDEPQENFFVLPLDTKRHPLCEPLCVARGTRDGVGVHVREVFREAIRWNARGVVVAHNHPTGDPTPSADDENLTRRLEAVSGVVGVGLLDHLVLGDPRRGRAFVSMRQDAFRGIMKRNSCQSKARGNELYGAGKKERVVRPTGI